MLVVDSHLEGVKPLFDAVSDGVVEPTAQPKTREGSRVVKAIDQKLCVFDIVFLSEAVEKRGCWIGAVMAEYSDIQQ